MVLAQVNLPAREQQQRHHEDGEYELYFVHHWYQLLHSFVLAGIILAETPTLAEIINIFKELLLRLGLNCLAHLD